LNIIIQKNFKKIIDTFETIPYNNKCKKQAHIKTANQPDRSYQLRGTTASHTHKTKNKKIKGEINNGKQII